jgi:hypothetical protein
MKLLFRQSCDCALTPEDLPKVSFKVTKGFDTDDDVREVYTTLDLLCAICGKPWESFAGLQYLPKSPKRIIGVNDV